MNASDRDVAYEIYSPGAANSPTKSGTFRGSTTVTWTVTNAYDFFYQWIVTSGAYRQESSPTIYHC